MGKKKSFFGKQHDEKLNAIKMKLQLDNSESLKTEPFLGALNKDFEFMKQYEDNILKILNFKCRQKITLKGDY